MRKCTVILAAFSFFFVMSCDGSTDTELIVETVAGNGQAGDVVGAGTDAQFNEPDGVTISVESGVDVAYMTDMGNNQVKKIDGDGVVTVVAGSSTAGFVDGPAATAQFNTPDGITTDSAGNIYVADTLNNAIRKIDTAGEVTTIAGGGPNSSGSTDGTGTEALFNGPTGITIDSSGNLYVADQGNDSIRKITPEAVVTTVVGGPTVEGYADGLPTEAKFNEPHGLTIDSAGNLYTTEWANDTVRKIEMLSGQPVAVSTIAGTGSAGDSDGASSAASLDKPHGIAVNGDGQVFVADENNNKIKKIDTTSDVVVTYVGTGEASFEDGEGGKAKLNKPRGLALGIEKNKELYICDYSNNRVRKVKER